jgi:AcrR family transcriptional regulator
MPRATLSDLEMERMRRRLAQGALELYAAQGTEAVSFRDLAQHLGISHTLPYRYFDNKDALFAQVRTDCFRELLRLMRAADPRGEPAPARLYALGYAIVDYVKAHPAQYRLMFSLQQPQLELYPELLQVRRDAFGYLVEVADTGVREGSLRGNALTLIHLCWVSVHGLLTLHAAGQLLHGRSLDQLMPPLLDTVIGQQLRQPTGKSAKASRAAPRRTRNTGGKR